MDRWETPGIDPFLYSDGIRQQMRKEIKYIVIVLILAIFWVFRC